MDRTKVSMPINKMYRNTESKDGRPYETPRISVYTDKDLISDKTFDGYVSCFDDGRRTGEWAEGMTVEVYLEKREVGDKTYWNIVFPSRLDLRMDELEKRVEALEGMVTRKDGIEKLPF